jgi:hypothetical protein
MKASDLLLLAGGVAAIGLAARQQGSRAVPQQGGRAVPQQGSRAAKETTTSDLFLKWFDLNEAMSEISMKLNDELPGDTSRIDVLDRLIAEAGGHNTALGHAIDLFSVRQRMIARRLEARTDVRPAPWE